MRKRKIKKLNLILIGLFLAGMPACGSKQSVMESIILNETLAQTGKSEADIEYIEDIKTLTEEEEISSDTKGVHKVVDVQNWSDNIYESRTPDLSAIIISDGGQLQLSEVKIEKDGDTSDKEDSDLFGKNAALLIKENSMVTVNQSSVKTNGECANAVFVTGGGSKAIIRNAIIETRGKSSKGISVIDHGIMTAEGVEITTAEENSPCIYSAGEINIMDSFVTADKSSIAVIEDKNIIRAVNCSLTGYGNDSMGGNGDGAGIKFTRLAQRMTEDNSEGSSMFTATDSTLSISEDSEQYNTVPMFKVLNSDAAIHLENTKLNYGSSILLDVSGNNGEEGVIGGNAELNAKNQELEGNIMLDQISSVIVSLTNSRLEGCINGENTGGATVIMDKDSIWEVNGDSYLAVLTNEEESCSNIISNGYTVYYSAENSANSWLKGRTIQLEGNGLLKPSEV